MHWDSIIGQGKVVELLRRSVDSGRVAHAYLFHGMEGTGKRAVALAFARELQCEGCNGSEPCTSCRQAAQLEHPDIHVLIPEPSDAKPRDVAERIALLAEDPYAAVDFVRAPTLGSGKNAPGKLKQAFYSVERINLHLRQQMMMRPLRGRYRIAIITDADTIREQAANTFLKLLEEPGPDTLFILTTSRKDLLLQTILSRCQHVAFDNLSPDMISRALRERKGIEMGLAEIVANMSQGSYLRALELTQSEELRRDRDRVLTFLRLAFTERFVQQTNLIAEISQSSRDRIRNLLRLLLSWIRDVALYREIGEDAPITNRDQKQEISKFSQNLQSADLDAMSCLIEEALLLSESNVNTTLLLMNLSMNLGKAMRSPHSGKLFKPLTSFHPIS
ncbi:MAG: DNA polymerase III subunit delta' [Bacteroidetes bacterium]|nr:DNA polymerase III subunit delta' [Bacteroidota bacterium]